MGSLLSKFLSPAAISRLRAIYLVLRDKNEINFNSPVLTWTHPGFLENREFNLAFDKAREISGYRNDIRWRAHVLAEIARHCLSFEGDFVECGTRTGLMAHTLIDYLGLAKSDRKFYLLDTWTGFDKASLGKDELHLANAEYDKIEFERIASNFAYCPNVVLVKGAVPGTLGRVESKKVSFVHIDMNCVAPEMAAAEFFWDRLTSGGAIVSDDYGHPGYEQQRRAYDAFAKAKGVSVLSLPTGTGVIFKP